jgi:two-component system sensor histidine kinase ChiS
MVRRVLKRQSQARQMWQGFLVWAALVLLTRSMAMAAGASPLAVDGLLDLSDWSWDSDGIVALNGAWEFYWSQLLCPEDFTRDLQASGFVDTPGAWNGHRVNGERLGGMGYATYRLRITLPQSIQPLALSLPAISTAYRLWVDGEEVASRGTVGTTRKESVPQDVPSVVTFTPTSSVTELVLQISNFSHRRGGMRRSVVLGTKAQMFRHRGFDFAVHAALLGAALVLGLLHISTYYLRPQTRAWLYSGLFSLLMSIRELFVGPALFLQAFPAFGWELALKVEYLTVYLGMPVAVLFFFAMYPQELSRRAVRLCLCVCGAFAVTVVASPGRVFSQALGAFHVVQLSFMLYLLHVLVLATFRKREGASLLLAGYLLVALAVSNDLLFYREKVASLDLSVVGLLVFLFFQSYAISTRFAHGFSETEQFARRLQVSDRLKSDFLTQMSTGLGTPLSAIAAMIEDMLHEASGAVNTGLQENLGLMLASARRLSLMVDDMSVIASLLTNSLSLHPEPCDLKHTVDTVLGHMAPLVGNRGLRLRNAVPDGLSSVVADPDRLQQTLCDLVMQAIRLSEAGEISVSALDDAAMVKIAVHASDPAISSKQMAQILGGGTADYEGMGMGLRVVRRLVDLHGGRIWVDSAIGKGLRVIFTLQRVVLRDRCELERAQRMLISSEEHVKREVAEALHGTVQTRLLVAWHRLGQCEELISSDPKKAAALIRSVRDEIDRLREEDIRSISRLLHPSIIDVGLIPAIESLTSVFAESMPIHLDVDEAVAQLDDPVDNRISSAVRLTAYRVLEDVLSNAQLHAKATEVKVVLRLEAGDLVLVVRDNGVGFDMASTGPGLGFQVISARVSLRGGSWSVKSELGEGTCVCMRLPLVSAPSEDQAL